MILRMMLLLGWFGLVSCGETKADESSNEGCAEKGSEGERINVCSFRFPIQETGFLCPEGTPYFFEFEEGAVCSENPDLSPEQLGVIQDGGLLTCEDSTSDFCSPITVSAARQADCNVLALETLCLSEAEQLALKEACEAAAIGAANKDWAAVNDCLSQSNNSQLGDGDFCVEISSCMGAHLRVCHEYNDECFSQRGGRLSTCDNLVSPKQTCIDEADRESLRMTCDNFVNSATTEDYTALVECVGISNNATDGTTICDMRVDCANPLLGL